jgi:hypothetical protein
VAEVMLFSSPLEGEGKEESPWRALPLSMTPPKTTIDIAIRRCHANGQIQVRQFQRNQRLLWGIGDTDAQSCVTRRRR